MLVSGYPEAQELKHCFWIFSNFHEAVIHSHVVCSHGILLCTVYLCDLFHMEVQNASYIASRYLVYEGPLWWLAIILLQLGRWSPIQPEFWSLLSTWLISTRDDNLVWPFKKRECSWHFRLYKRTNFFCGRGLFGCTSRSREIISRKQRIGALVTYLAKVSYFTKLYISLQVSGGFPKPKSYQN